MQRQVIRPEYNHHSKRFVPYRRKRRARSFACRPASLVDRIDRIVHFGDRRQDLKITLPKRLARLECDRSRDRSPVDLQETRVFLYELDSLFESGARPAFER